MFPIHFKLTISTPEELARVTAFVAAGYAAQVEAAPKLPEAPGKPTSAAAPASKGKATAPTPPTASAVADAAPEKTAAASSPAAAPAAAPSPASTAAGEAFQYKTLQGLVLKLLPTHPEQLSEIAKKHGQPHGASTFKTLPPECWPAAYADVQALEAAGV